MAVIKGVWGTLLLPIRPDESIDFALAEEQARILAGSGVDGIYSNGTAGEFWTLTEEEFERQTQILAGICQASKLPFQVGACHSSPQVTLQRIERSKHLNPTAFQVIVPDWLKPSMAELADFQNKLGKHAHPIPLVLYNPPHAKWKLTPEELLELSRHVPSLAGFKLAGGDDEWFAAMRPLLESHSVFTPGHTLASGFSKGSSGSYSNIACLSPRGAAWWYRMMKEDLSKALEIEDRIQVFRNAHIVPLWQDYGYNSAAIDKLWAYIGNWCPCTTRLRWPYRGVPESLGNELRAIVRTALPEFFKAL